MENKLTEGKRGRPFGFNHSEETKEKIRQKALLRRHSKETKKKISESEKGSKNHNWKGGRKIDSQGYVNIYMPEHPSSNRYGYIFEHRLIAERVLGRPLRKNEVVHHIDGDKQNNKNSNLLICERWYHWWLHIKINKLRRVECQA